MPAHNPPLPKAAEISSGEETARWYVPLYAELATSAPGFNTP